LIGLALLGACGEALRPFHDEVDGALDFRHIAISCFDDAGA
jgi:hypothetical protein